MSTRERADAFVRFVGLELKGRITANGFTAAQVAQRMGRSPAAFNRWLNNKQDIPMAVLCEACEIIDSDPMPIIEEAYSRMAILLGERDGHEYPADDVAVVQVDQWKRDLDADDDPDYSQMTEEDAAEYGLAAYKGDPNIGYDDIPHEP